jgi:hypothetical protein
MKKQTTKHIALSFDDWADKYQPQANTIISTAPFDGLMYETYGDELTHVLSIANTGRGARVWTWVDCDDCDDGVIVEGYQLINRIGYFITERPAQSNTTYNVTID